VLYVDAVCVVQVLIEGHDGKECEATIAEDWAHDCHGRDAISREVYQDALFECVA
jgi:hypothetical protein